MALVNKAFSVSVVPGMMPPIVHVSEYDIGRAYTVSIIDEQGNPFTIPSGTTASIEGTLNGKVGFTQSASISNNQVSFALSQSMTAHSGKAWCKIKLTQNSQPIQTCAFILAVDRAGVEADTVIGAPGFEEQIREAVDESVTEYLEEHPVVVDPTLSISGEAADAAKTGEIRTALNEIDNLQSSSEGGTTPQEVDLTYTLEDGAINSTGADVDGSGSGDWSTYYLDSSCRTVGFISIADAISAGLSFVRSPNATLPQNATHFYTYLVFYDANYAFISRSGGEDATTISVDSVPENAAYVRASFTFTKQADVLSSRIYAVQDVTTGDGDHPIVDAVLKNKEDIEAMQPSVTQLETKVPTKGIVLGDSISFGLYSFWDGNNRKNADDLTNNIDETAADKRISDWLADYYGIPIDNIAKRGTGWVADTRNLGNAWVKAQATDFSQYGFVALCFGINDWIQASTLGTIANNTVGTVIGNMIHTIEKIYTDNPLCKVVVFSPLNTWGQWRDTTGALQTFYGDAASHYALGTANSAGYTLQQLIDAMDSVCDAYDIRHVVMSQGCTINMFNIKNVLIDGLHPSEDSMQSIASDMYHTMLFK